MSETLLVGQSGGPTAVINASLAGVVAAAQESGRYGRILGMRHGVQGALAGDLIDLTNLDAAAVRQLAHTPSSALGSCRYKLQDGDLDRLVDLVKRERVTALTYIGGNDSADTTNQIGDAAHTAGLGLRVIGVPKTIDNDLPGTDHCPGYGSAARFLAQVTRETALDTSAMRHTDPIRIIEVMGRHAGWLPGAAWLAKEQLDDAPHLVYVPERAVPVDQIVADVWAVYKRLGWCVVVMCENQPAPDGQVIGGSNGPRWVDAFGHAYYDSPAESLCQTIREKTGVRARFDKPGTIQRMATAYVSSVDRDEAELVGRQAVSLANAGVTGVMVTLERQPGVEYRISTGTVPLQVVANEARNLPAEFINTAGNGMTDAFLDYARPLIGAPLPSYARLLD